MEAAPVQDGGGSGTTTSTLTTQSLPKRATFTRDRILSVTNPDILAASPRRGGFLKIVTPSKSQNFSGTSVAPSLVKSDITTSRTETDSNLTEQLLFKKSRMSTTSSFSRCCRYCPNESQATLKEHPFGGDLDMDLEFDETEEFDQPQEVAETAGMLAVTISTVMLMASRNKISDEYLEWAENYLSCIQDDNGQFPPNVKGILNHIKNLREVRKGSAGPGTCSCTL